MELNIILIGFMGTGKTTVGQVLAEKTGRVFYDTDTLIEKRAGMTISDIFARMGEEYFRILEHQILSEAVNGMKKVLATGGGIVLNPKNMITMKENGIVVALKAEVDTLWERLDGATGRPLLNKNDPKNKLIQLYKNRAHLYEEAHFTIIVDHKTPLAIAEEIIKQIKKLSTKGV